MVYIVLEDRKITMDTVSSFSIIALAALIQASFQLGISMVTLLSNHARGKKITTPRTLRMVGSFLLGTICMVTLIVSAIAYISALVFRHGIPMSMWLMMAGLLVATGVVVWAWYYRRGDGTALWLPRGLARFLHTRVHATQLAAEAFSLGLTSVVAELAFTVCPAIVAALSLLTLPVHLQPLGLLLYIGVASLGTLLVTVLIGSGRTLGNIQRWRTANKRFLQFAAGSGFVVLGFYIYVTQVVTPVTVLAGVQ